LFPRWQVVVTSQEATLPLLSRLLWAGTHAHLVISCSSASTLRLPKRGTRGSRTPRIVVTASWTSRGPRGILYSRPLVRVGPGCLSLPLALLPSPDSAGVLLAMLPWGSIVSALSCTALCGACVNVACMVPWKLGAMLCMHAVFECG
jgi:hypothetical protein